MAESFDPYHVWLGIPPEDQPPNHYRLLGIRPFEANPDVIDNTADQRMTHLRTFQTGKNAKASQKLLNEVAAARLCLLNAKTKDEYDRKLKASLPAASSGVALASQSAVGRAAGQSGKPPQAASQSKIGPAANGAASPGFGPPGSGPSGPPPIPGATPSREAVRRQPGAMPVAQAIEAPAAARPAIPTIAVAASTHRPKPRRNLTGPLVGGGVALVAVVGIGIAYAVINQNGSDQPTNPQPPPSNPAVASQSTTATPPAPASPETKQPATAATLVFNTKADDRSALKVLVDDKPVPPGAGDIWEFSLPPGQHQVHAVRTGFKPFDATVVAAAGQRLPIELDWQPQPVLRFAWPPADREGASLLIDGRPQPIGAENLEFPLEPGQHQIRIMRRGFVAQNKTVNLTPSANLPPLVPQWIPVPAVAQNTGQNNLGPNNAGQNSPTLKASKTIDLLALIDPQATGVRGQWKKENGALVSDQSHPSIMPIPYTPQGEYRITMVCERVEGDDSIAVGLPFDGNIFTAGVDCFADKGGFAGVEVIDGMRVDQTPYRKNGRFITNGKQTTLIFGVLKNRFWLAQDAQVLVSWPNADYRRASLFAYYKGVDETKPFITTWSSSYKITRLTLTPLNEQPGAAVAQNPAKPMPEKVAGNDNPPKPVEKPKPANEPKAAVPDAAAQAAAAKTIQGIYRDDLKRSTSPEQKLDLARKLRTDGRGTADDPAGRYLLLKMARDLAAGAGDLELAGDVLDDMAECYEMDALEAKAELLIASSKSPQHPDDCSAKLNALADDAVAADRYDLAKKVITAALTLKDPALRKQTLIHQKEIAETETEFHKLKPTIDSLNNNADDPASNLAVGKFDCLVKGNFEAGLPLLAKGSDKALADLAKLELANPSDPAEQIKIADGWWDTGKRAARLHAKGIYETVLPGLNGITRVKIEKRLQEMEAKSGETWTNLLRLVDPTKNMIRGTWTKTPDGLQNTQAGFGQMVAVPFEPAANYEVRAEFTRLTGNNDVMLILPVAGTNVRLTLGVNEKWGGLDRINNQMVFANSPLARPAPVENNKRYTIDAVVRTSADAAEVQILVRVNGADFTSFQGPATQLSGLPYNWRLTNPKNLALGANNATAVFHSLQYRKLTAKSGK